MQITEATRRDIIDLFTIEEAHWAGRLEDTVLLNWGTATALDMVKIQKQKV